MAVPRKNMIEISDLTKRYGQHTVLDGIDFRVEQGQIAAVVGPSGAGKSTLARCINLLERPTSGSIRVSGQELTDLSRRELRVARRAIGTVFQSASLLRRLTAAQNVALPLQYLKLSHEEKQQRVRELLARVGMLHRANHYPAHLSGGQRQRIGLARGLALRPSVLLADEATSGLDPEATASILRLLTELRDDLGVTVVVITHEMDVVRTVADVVAQLDHGRIVEQGPVGEVVRRSDSALSRALLPAPPTDSVSDGPRIWHLRYERGNVDPNWLGRISRELGSDIAVLAALVETVGGDHAGRLTVGVDRQLRDERVRAAFGAHGIHASRSAPADEGPSPEAPADEFAPAPADPAPPAAGAAVPSSPVAAESAGVGGER
jgi:ABC-type methionine transport system ATPase subunit